MLDNSDTGTGKSITVNLELKGTGHGKVTSMPKGLDCESGCAVTFKKSDETINFTATPAADSIFIGWKGDCNGESCSIDSQSNRQLTAVFDQKTASMIEVAISLSGSGSGTVTSMPAGIHCGETCDAEFKKGSGMITLSAVADEGSVFKVWEGDCQGTTCSIDSEGSHEATAVFDKKQVPTVKLSVSMNGSGKGKVISTPAGIDCGAICESDFEEKSGMVTLSAQADDNSIFAGWAGDCNGNTCTLDSESNHSVSAIFNLAEEKWSLSTAKLDFVGITNGDTPKAKLITLNNSGDFTVNYSVSDLPAWLTVSPESGAITAGNASEIQIQPGDCSVNGRDEASIKIGTGGHSETVAVTRVCGSAANIDFSLERFYINQAVPAMDTKVNRNRQVPVVINRKGLARAFVSANKSTDLVPEVVLNYRTPNGKTGRVDFPTKNSLSTSVREGGLGDTFNLELAKEFLVEGLEFYIEVDPDNAIAEVDETNNRLPKSGYFSGMMTLGERFDITFVPITLDGVPHRDTSMEKMNRIVDHVRKIHPLSEIDIEVHAPLNIPAGGRVWQNMIDGIRELRRREGSSRAYTGLVDSDNRALDGKGISGLGYVSLLVNISIPSGGVIAHELGHNLSLPHAPCGNPGRPDSEYPYRNGQIGIWGYDMKEKSLKAPDKYNDLMGYCGRNWISDYNYNNVIEFRKRLNSRQNKMAKQAAQNVLIVEGSIESGKLAIDTVFSFNTRLQETEEGEYVLNGFDKVGNALFSQSFRAYELTDGSASHFGISIPAGEQLVERLDRLEVLKSGKVIHTRKAALNLARQLKVKATVAQLIDQTDDRVEVLWDKSAYQAILVRDPVSNEVLGSDESGRLLVHPKSHIIEAIYSNGLQSHSEMVTVQTATK